MYCYLLCDPESRILRALMRNAVLLITWSSLAPTGFDKNVKSLFSKK